MLDPIGYEARQEFDEIKDRQLIGLVATFLAMVLAALITGGLIGASTTIQIVATLTPPFIFSDTQALIVGAAWSLCQYGQYP